MRRNTLILTILVILILSLPSFSQAQKENIDKNFIGKWEATAGSIRTVVTLKRDGSFVAKGYGPSIESLINYTGTWNIENNMIIWIYDQDAIPLNEKEKDTNLILEVTKDKFIIKEMDGSITTFRRVENNKNKNFTKTIVLKSGKEIKGEVNKNDVINELFELSGAKESTKRQVELFKNMTNEIAKYLETQGQAVDKDVYDKIGKTFKVNKYYRVVINTFEENYDQSRFSDVLEWLRSPLYSKIYQTNEASSINAVRQERENFFSQLKFNPPSQKRLDLFEIFNENTHSIEFTIKLGFESSRLQEKIINLWVPPSRRVPEEVIKETLEQKYNELVEEMKSLQNQPAQEDSPLVEFLYTYHGLSDKELKKIIDFDSSDLGKWYLKTYREIIWKVLAKTEEEINKLDKVFPKLGEKK